MDVFSQPSTSTASQSRPVNNDDQGYTMALKFQYMNLIDEANGIANSKNDQSVRQSLAQINNVIDKADHMLSKVRDTTALFLDAKVIHSTTATLEYTTENIDVGEGNFQLFPFAEQFKVKALNDEGRPHWKTLAAVARPVIQNSIPSWTPLLGSFEFSAEVLASQQRKVRQIRKRDEVVEKKEPSKNTEESNTKEGVEKIVQQVFEKLKKNFKHNRKPINYFKFVVNPESFSDTVENIFHVSFLVNDGHARIEIVDGHPVISPVMKDKENAHPDDVISQEKERKQMIMPMDMDLWEALINVFDIKTAMI